MRLGSAEEYSDADESAQGLDYVSSWTLASWLLNSDPWLLTLITDRLITDYFSL